MTSDGCYLDNDVVLKTCAYGVGADLVKMSTCGTLVPAILALAKYTLCSTVRRSRTIVDQSTAANQLCELLDRVRLLEPTPDEIMAAAELESAAMAANLSFDAGESQLVAMLIARNGLVFISGDKRAAKAISEILPELERRLACLEQVMHTLVTDLGLDPIRRAVCREVNADRATAICFQCASPQVDAAAVQSALVSYTNALRSDTGSLLVEGAGVSLTKIA